MPVREDEEIFAWEMWEATQFDLESVDEFLADPRAARVAPGLLEQRAEALGLYRAGQFGLAVKTCQMLHSACVHHGMLIRAREQKRTAPLGSRKGCTAEEVAAFCNARSGEKFEVWLADAAATFSVSERTIASRIKEARTKNLMQ